MATACARGAPTGGAWSHTLYCTALGLTGGAVFRPSVPGQWRVATCTSLL